MKLGVATCRERPALQADDRLMLDLLEATGVATIFARPWDDGEARWHECAAVLVRSVWDYHLRVDEFLERPPVPWGGATQVEVDQLRLNQLRALGYVVEE